MVLKFGRRLSLKNIFCLFIILSTMLILYFLNSSNKRYDMNKWEKIFEDDRNTFSSGLIKDNHLTNRKLIYDTGETICRPLASSRAKIDTFEVFQKFNFQPSWLRTSEYWDSRFEEAYQRSRNVRHSYPLKVILMPHSHNDPGWLLKFEDYYNKDSKTILSNAVSKLTEYKNLTFIWSEIAFLSRWWDERHSDERQLLKKLVKEGRFEITTGGWVMNDEATSTYFAMIDQLIEGHQWVKNNLGVNPKYGWSIDPFGHGSTLPFLLAESDIKGSVIQRIHYSWKQALAKNKSGDFYWIPNWKSNTKMLIHNQPYDIYSIKHSCGPHPQICLNFDFRSVFGEYSESTAQNITNLNVQHFSELLLEQFQKTASLFPHNVVLMPIGDDFRYKNINEFDQQYINYQKIANYINSHSRFYNNTEFEFGTLSTYFTAIDKRMNSNFPTLKGDFFPYSDIFSERRPAYWTGYYTTRPFFKILCRELENNLRTSEILFTIALNRIQQNKSENLTRRFESLFAKLTVARRYLALFQHHDAITGTSKQTVMEDYGLKLTEAIRISHTVQESSIQSLLYPQLVNIPNLISTLSDRKYSDNFPRKIPIRLNGFVNEQKSFVIFNSLGQQAQHLVQFHILMLNPQNVHMLKNLELFDAANQEIDFQITPVVNHFPNNLSESEFEVSFISNLTALTINTYYLKITANENNRFATIICDKRDQDCSKNVETTNLFSQESISFMNDVILENNVLEATFDATSGLLSALRHNDFDKRRASIACKLTFGMYSSAQSHSGAYLFMRDPNMSEKSKDVLDDLKSKKSIRVVKGRIYSELHVQYDKLLVHKVRLYQQPNSSLLNGLYIENEVDYGVAPNYRDQEMFMRISSDVQNGLPPISYTDVNGLHMQKRIKVPAVDLEGNYWPITNLIFIQDSKMRLNLLTDHAQGASAFEPGSLEVMVDRRTLYDDGRGLNEGVTDNRKTLQRHWIVVEKIADKMTPSKANAAVSGYEYEDEPLRNYNVVNDQTNRYVSMSGYVQYLTHLLNYQPNLFVSNNDTLTNNQNNLMKIVKDELPCDVHLVNVRTRNHPVFDQDPSPSAFLTLFRNYFDCSIIPNSNSLLRSCFQIKEVDLDFIYAIPDTIQEVSLTGLHTVQKLNHFSDIVLSPMQIKTLNVTFV